MDIYLLDKDFNLIANIDQFSTLIWNRKYYTCGSFELHASITCYQSFANAHYVYIKDKAETGVVQKFGCDKSEGTAYIKGNFLEIELARYVIPFTHTYTGTPEMIARNIFEDHAKRYTFINLGSVQGLGTPISTQFTGKDVMAVCYEILKTQELSIQAQYDYITNTAKLTVWQGKNRTDRQTANSQAVFSDNFENIITSSYIYDESEFKNFAYVAGQNIIKQKLLTNTFIL